MEAKQLALFTLHFIHPGNSCPHGPFCLKASVLHVPFLKAVGALLAVSCLVDFLMIVISVKGESSGLHPGEALKGA